MQSRCDQLFQRMKQVALPAFGVEDVLVLVAEATARFGTVSGIPCALLVDGITAFKPRFRRRYYFPAQ
jgi:hypothetical protein